MVGEGEQPRARIVRPVRWERLRADEAEREIRRRLEIGDPIITDHAYDRMAERGGERLLDADVLRILHQGSVRQAPSKEPNGWSVTVERRMAGGRDAGVVTVIVHPGDDLIVVTVEWMDWRIR